MGLMAEHLTYQHRVGERASGRWVRGAGCERHPYGRGVVVVTRVTATHNETVDECLAKMALVAASVLTNGDEVLGAHIVDREIDASIPRNQWVGDVRWRVS